MPTVKKIETVQKLAEKLARAKSVVLANYQGLSHRQLEELRKTAKAAEGDFMVVKNTLLDRAILTTNYQLPTTDFSGPTALLLSYHDEIAPLQAIAKFIKQFQLPTLKIGVLAGKLLHGEELLAITRLPSKEVLLAQLTGQVASPLYRLHHALRWNLQRLVLTLKALENTKSQ